MKKDQHTFSALFNDCQTTLEVEVLLFILKQEKRNQWRRHPATSEVGTDYSSLITKKVDSD